MDLSLAPERIQQLPRNENGLPVLWCGGSESEDKAIRLGRAIRNWRCFICGEKLGKRISFCMPSPQAFVRMAKEPPSHKSCAEWFIHNVAASNHLVWCIWDCDGYDPVVIPEHGGQFRLRAPTAVSWHCHGIPASRDLVLASIEAALPSMQQIRETDVNRLMVLAAQYKNLEPWLPPKVEAVQVVDNIAGEDLV